CPGVFHSTPSTPGVRFPRFLVTRRTAHSFAKKLWARRRCKAFTLPGRLSFSAFAIRICSRRTCRSTARHWVACHSAQAERAPGTLRLPVICVLSCWWFLRFSRDERPVGRLLAFAPGDVATGIRTITARHSLFPTSQSRTPIDLPYG